MRKRPLPRVFWVLFAGQLVNRTGAMVLTFLVFYLSSRGLSPARIGVVLTAAGIGGLASQPLGGILADRLGRKSTLVAGMSATAGCMLLLAAATDRVSLTVLAALLGLTGDVYRPAAAALVADVVPRDQRTKAYGLMFWAINLGYPIAGAAGGLLAGHGYWLLFAADALTCLLFAAIIALGVPSAPPPHAARTSASRPVRRDPLFLTFVLLTVGYGMVYGQAIVGVPLAMRDHGLPPGAYAAVSVVNGGLIILLQPLAGAWLGRFAPLRVLAVSWTVVGIGMGLTGFAATVPEYAATAAIWTLGEIGVGGLLGGVVANLAPAYGQGRYQAVFGFGSGLSKMASSAAGTAVYATAGPSVLWWGCAGLGAGCAAAALLLSPAAQRRTARTAVEEEELACA